MYRISNEIDIYKAMLDNKIFLRDSVPAEVAKEADRLEVWGSSFQDDGADFCEFRFFKNDQLIHKVKVDGY